MRVLSIVCPCAQVDHSFELRRLGWYFAAWRQSAALSRQLRAVGTAAASRHLARTAHQVFKVPQMGRGGR